MDTSRIDEFVRYIDDFQRVEVAIINKRTEARSAYIELHEKYNAFEKCIYELCVDKGNNITILLLVYRDKLNDSLSKTRWKLNHYLQNDGEKTPIYIKVRGFVKLSHELCFKAIKCLDRLLHYHGMKKECTHDNTENNTMTSKHCPTVGTPSLNNDTTTKTNDVYYTTSFSDKTLEKVYDYLIKRGCLHPETLLSDFIYYFTGRGEKAKDGLKWKGKDAKKVRLAYFINTIIKGGRDQDKSYWKKAEIIFAVKGLANSYSMSNSNNDNTSNEQFVDDIEKLLK